jgi:hypothetical protein
MGEPTSDWALLAALAFPLIGLIAWLKIRGAEEPARGDPRRRGGATRAIHPDDEDPCRNSE